MKLTLMGIAVMDRAKFPSDLFAYNLASFLPCTNNYLELIAKKEIYWQPGKLLFIEITVSKNVNLLAHNRVHPWGQN